ncbi:bifunctional precorrin-2 dehydrogenase/sirohydrochlorin ferrochelatase [Enterococcus sp.]|uniref:precorrin-2 dehydrogenase/sirohydrochlorin ferrochelatase family protein n=1 Tax=Enterococcus sp. TaxID=35783 RepID=UPI0029103294|nr:bifunctional precorrin-2 dehydrogenase/sirohydrochlorin ferrochelatase [Enterococcus sp.]MDU5337267.1 bifunctional precorrin-2 dehydrogenase/sirohydrochlorin ferrochelatase [Enterococcus sp.]
MYPIIIDIKKFPVLIIGGGRIATRKTKSLVEAGAVPTILATEFTDEIKVLAEHGKVLLKERAFQRGDTRGFQFVFICTNDENTNQQILEETTPQQLVNDTTKQSRSNFFNMAVIRESDFEIAITTKGKSPTEAKQLKEKIKDFLKSAT